ncbi:hypothetical protein BZG02_06915 [Labilibaculum filiforme]|uniref:Uncharacterized protein n=1 Tax=Labilibaculum filiforme TaxID=1940526 RepID=A0A2N3I0C9_9BACT|nr:hypothetical protein [Labilibaculum filiforme]PKQ63754.1 hypothetical protein BZG02_06915 [Labilibaculum filiforme]
MELKKIVGFVLLGLAIITFFLYLSLPFILSGSSKIILLTASVYVLNKVFFYSSLYILGKQFILKYGKYLPKWIEKRLLKLLKVQTVVENAQHNIIP